MTQARDAYMRPEGDTTAPHGEDPLARIPAALDCVHCGLCLSACPTYLATGNETDSPRGRIALMRAQGEGRLAPEEVAPAVDRCVLCRACEPVCPSQVRYHELVEVQREGTAPPALTRLLDATLRSRFGLRVAGGLARVARRTGLLALAARVGPRRLRALAGAVPRRPRRLGLRPGSTLPAAPPQRGRVALHAGCANVELFGRAVEATARLLAAEGFAVHLPEQPPCCGALHAHSGMAARGRTMAGDALQALAGCDAVLSPSAGCAAHLAELDPRAGVDEPLRFLERAGLRGRYRLAPTRVAYDPPCHLQNVLGDPDSTARLLDAVEGVRRVPHAHADVCCGAGGISFAREPELGATMMEHKARDLAAAAPEVVVSGNPGCLMQIEAGLRARGDAGVRVLHPAELLLEAQAG